MSGHSKWAQIKRQKGVADQKRGAAFTKLSNAITIAIKQGAGVSDPTQNFKLRLAIDAAKAVNMPKDTIERAMQRAAGKQAGNLEEVIYEGFAPLGASVIIEATTDNNMRTTAEIKSLFNKAGASFGQPGSVSYQFKQMGQVHIKRDKRTIDEILLLAVEIGAEDIEDIGNGEVLIYTNPSDLKKVKDQLNQKDIQVIGVMLTRKPILLKTITSEQEAEKIIQFIDRLEELDDVQRVYSNIDIKL